MMTAITSDDICVVMPIHCETSAEHLRLALESLSNQTMPAGEVILVEDGPLTQAHRSVIGSAAAEMPALRVVSLDRVGLVEALNTGLAHARAPWVARMDADDVADPDRLRLQASAASEGTAEVIGTAMLEFTDDPGDASTLRRVPEDHDTILRRLRTLNPINHPTVLMRREVVVRAGGYLPLAGLEDYFLWVRLAVEGIRFRNLPDPLVHYRLDDATYRRRADRAAIRAEWHLQRHLRQLGLVGPVRSAANLVVRVGFRLLPPRGMRRAYRVVHAVVGGTGHAT
jgi:glycosyltransferase involved in cell wall biosynthesis